MSHLTNLSLRLASVVFLAVALLFGAGVYAATHLQQDLLPAISVPTFAVVTPYPGASPGVIDETVSLLLSNAFQTLRDVSSVSTTSTSGVSIVTVSFNDGTDPNQDQQALTSGLEKVRATLPAQAQRSTIQAFSTSDLPILQYAVYADEPLDSLAGQVRSSALPALKGLSGVSTVSLTGGPTVEVDVTLDPTKLVRHGLSVAQVASALQQASVVQSIGSLQDDGHTVPLQVAETLTSLDQIENVVVSPASTPAGSAGGAVAGRPIGAGSPPRMPGPSGATTGLVAVKDLGTVALASVPADTITRTNGKASLGLGIIKVPDASTVTVANAIRGVLPGVEATIGHGVKFQVILDQATPITDSIAAILKEGLIGAAFAILVIFAFLRSIRATVVAAISIPLSLLVALLVLWWQGITLNVLTLGGMMVAIGRVVDDAIVVLENISRHVSEGESALGAAYTGSREIITAVTSSTLTTVGVFLPIVFLNGIAGDFFRPFALTVVVALVASLLVAVTVVPLLASRLLPARPDAAANSARALQAVYVPVIRWAIGHRAFTLGAAVLFFLGSMALVPQLRLNLFDQSSSPDFPVQLKMPVSATLAQTNAETAKVETLIKNVHGVAAYQAVVGGISDPFAPPGSVPADPTAASVTVLVRSGQYNPALNGVKQALTGYSGPAKVEVGQAQSSANASSSRFSLNVNAANSADLATATSQVTAALAGVKGLTDLKSNLATSKPQYQLTPTAALAQSGLTTQQLAGIVASEVNGQVAVRATLPDGLLDVRVALAPGAADTPTALMSINVPTAAGTTPLRNLASLQMVPGPKSVNRTNGDRTATITGTITSNNTQAVQKSVEAALKRLELRPGVSTSAGGAFAQLSSVLNQFIVALLVAIGLVYVIMVATFRSLLKPLVLLVSIPFAASGAIIALVVTGTSLSLPGMIGLVMLTGIVVTNAIVLLDLVEQYRDRGVDLHDALIEGGRRRLRPILMTALATMLALVPLAVSGGGGGAGGAFISAPLAIVVIGGLFTSTVLTLILVPVVYSLISRFTPARSQPEIEAELEAASRRRFSAPGGAAAPQ